MPIISKFSIYNEATRRNVDLARKGLRQIEKNNPNYKFLVRGLTLDTSGHGYVRLIALKKGIKNAFKRFAVNVQEDWALSGPGKYHTDLFKRPKKDEILSSAKELVRKLDLLEKRQAYAKKIK